MYRNPELYRLEQEAGIVFDGAVDIIPRIVLTPEQAKAMGSRFGAVDAKWAADAQPVLTTTPNAGVPNIFTTYVDPKVVEVLFAPNKAAEIYGEAKKGDWPDDTIMIPMAESTGQSAAYGDFSENGRAGVNAQFENRQVYRFQTFTEWGELELERAARARLDWVTRLNVSSALQLSKTMNTIAFYGVSGLMNYGGLNDPSLSAALTPTTKTAGGTSWSVAQPQEILADIILAFNELQTQTGGNLDFDIPLTLALSPQSQTYLLNTNQYGLRAIEVIKAAFPNLKVVQAVQYLSSGVYSFQLIADEVQGQRTVETAFNQKMRAHPVIPAASAWRQKKSAGSWGTIIYFPAGIASMAGI